MAGLVGLLIAMYVVWITVGEVKTAEFQIAFARSK